MFKANSEISLLKNILKFTGLPTAEDKVLFCSPFSEAYVTDIGRVKSKRIIDMFPHVSDDACDLLKCLLYLNPKNRITAKQALLHPYFASSFVDETKQIPFTKPLVFDEDYEYINYYHQNREKLLLKQSNQLNALKKSLNKI